jgi:hypothetical protein
MRGRLRAARTAAEALHEQARALAQSVVKIEETFAQSTADVQFVLSGRVVMPTAGVKPLPFPPPPNAIAVPAAEAVTAGPIADPAVE